MLKKLNDLYIKLTHVRKDNFLKAFDDGSSDVHHAKLTLLPHQVLIMPESFILGLEQDFIKKYQILTDKEVR